MTSPIVFLHIGMNKTGSSALQQYFHDQQSMLAGRGVLYPTTGQIDTAHKGLSNMLGFAPPAVTDSGGPAEEKKFWSDLRKETDKHAPRTIIFSSEGFVRQGSPETVARFLGKFNVKVVVYLRRHDHWWLSVYNQALKTRPANAQRSWKPNFRSFLEHNRRQNPRMGNFRQLLDQWAGAFGKDNILVRPYEAQQNQPNIVADFLTTIGHAELAPAQLPSVNSSHDARTTRILEIAHGADINADARARIILYARRHGGNGKPFSADPALLRELVVANQADYQYIAREYLGRQDGQLFLEPLPEPGKTPFDSPEPSLEEIMGLVVKALGAPAGNPRAPGNRDAAV